MPSHIYECVFLASSSLSEGGVSNLMDNFNAAFAENNIKVLRQENWGSLALAYKIKNHTKANYFMFVISAEPTALQKFEAKLKYNDLVLRYLLQRKREFKVPDGVISLKLPQYQQ
ncbi:30S ribosomal protein S6 [Neorickettsia sp. 179522]|uniref:30S ribosomal protein S6 n=1 Tax=Neorickettsia sp. 179522 TaxID=1714371 RepID=UPI0007929BEA|nr:30S ribosomal protein S6 [Neorickettsia sp. 179522]KYH12258.1 30S ribosomal protein S6 [Neorickettsia sp. 179522]